MALDTFGFCCDLMHRGLSLDDATQIAALFRVRQGSEVARDAWTERCVLGSGAARVTADVDANGRLLLRSYKSMRATQDDHLSAKAARAGRGPETRKLQPDR